MGEFEEVIKITKNLSKGAKNEEVKYLQEFLSKYPEIYPEGLVTGYFGSLTEVAVKRFQEKNAEDILIPLGLTGGTGYVGEATRAKINDLILASVSSSAQGTPAVTATPATQATPAIPATPITQATPTTLATPAIPITPTMKLYESYSPKFIIDPMSPTGTLIPSANALLAIFDVKAMGNKDMTFDGAADPAGGDEDDVLVLQVASTHAQIDLVVKDQDGNTLDDPALAPTTNIVIDFTNKDFVVPAGEIRKLYIYGDTSAYTTKGDSIQVWLDDDGAAINWSINYDDGDYSETAIIFRGDIYAGALVKP
ncbi:MAG: peptidoglycan-binding protein [Candidatus Nealsonbacteria bacterium]|nr:peptidoglycan-binding protein [Candidatus Nealsonbacteria bacterium]